MTEQGQHNGALQRSHYKERPASESSESDDLTIFQKPPKTRKSNIYDAVAGK
jgi:hypothetical protein